MRTRLFFLVLSMIFTAGCVGKLFQPIPPKFKQWHKEGVSVEGVKTALIECGYDNPYNGFQTTKKVAADDIIRADLCMERKGFHYLLGNGKPICDDKYFSTLPVCTGGAILGGRHSAQ